MKGKPAKDLTLADLEAEACSRANILSASVCDKIEVGSLPLNSKLPFKALSFREVLLHRFADQSLGASNAISHRNAISAATLTRGSLETFARLFEFHERLAHFFKDPRLDDLDNFLMVRLFGTRQRQAKWPEAINVLTTIDRVKNIIPNFRENYDRLSEIAHPNYAGGLGVFQRLDAENHIIYLGDKVRIEQNLMMISLMLVGTQKCFETFYNSTRPLMEELNNYFEDGLPPHT